MDSKKIYDIHVKTIKKYIESDRHV
jgi:hypothetical protein